MIALSTGGAGTIGTIGAGSRVLIAGSAIATKAGTKVYDIQNTVTDSAERNGKYGSVILILRNGHSVFGHLTSIRYP